MADDPIIKKLDDVKTSISGSIDKLAKQNAEQSRKDSETITLEENIGSLAEVAATFKAQTKQMEHEKKEKMHEVDDRLDDMLLQDEKYQKKHLAALKKTEQNDGQADSQETEVIQEEKKSRKKTSDVIKKIGKNVGKFTGLAFTMNKLGGAAKITFWGALMGGMMVALIKFLDSATWKEFRSWIFADDGLSKQMRDMGLSFKEFHRVFFSRGGSPGRGGPFGGFLGIPGGLGLFPFLGELFDLFWREIGEPAWLSLKSLIVDITDPSKSWMQVLQGNLGAILGVGGSLWLLALGLSPALLFTGLIVGGAWIILDKLGQAGSAMANALGGLAIGMWGWVKRMRRMMTGVFGDPNKGRGAAWKNVDPMKTRGGDKVFKTDASKTGHMKWDPDAYDKKTGLRTGQFREWNLAKGGPPGQARAAGFKFGSFLGGWEGGKGADAFKGSRMAAYQARLAKYPRMAKVLKLGQSGGFKMLRGASKLLAPIAAIFSTYEAMRIIMDPNLTDDERITELGALAGSILGSLGFAMLGASLGAAFTAGNPLGALGGALVGAYAGGAFGSEMGGVLMGWLLGKKKVTPSKKDKQKKMSNKQIGPKLRNLTSSSNADMMRGGDLKWNMERNFKAYKNYGRGFNIAPDREILSAESFDFINNDADVWDKIDRGFITPPGTITRHTRARMSEYEKAGLEHQKKILRDASLLRKQNEQKRKEKENELTYLGGGKYGPPPIIANTIGSGNTEVNHHGPVKSQDLSWGWGMLQIVAGKLKGWPQM